MEHFFPRVDNFLVFVEPSFHLPHEGEGKQTEPHALWCNIFYDDCVTQLEVLEMCVCVLTKQTTEWVCLHHHDEASLELKVFGGRVDSRLKGHVGNRGDRVVTE
jgi:hypothetical protein